MMERALIEYVINALWQVPLLAGGAWLLVWMARPSPLIQHYLWLTVLGLAVLLPVRGMGFAGVSVTPHTGTVIEASHQEVLAPLAQNNLPQRRNQGAAFGPLFAERTGNLRLTTRTAHWLLRLYVATIVIGLFRMTRAWLAARTLVKNSQEICLVDRDRGVLEDYSHRLGIQPPQLRESTEVSSPMIVGARTPVLLLPEGFDRHTENEIRAALCHELAHIQRQDYLLNVACQLAAVPLAWHPAVDWIQQRIHMTREMVCDAMAAQEMKSHLGYAKCLLALAHSMLGKRGTAAQAHFLGLFGNHTLEERVMRLMDTTTMSVRAKAARVASGAAMMIATGVIAGLFHVTPTMAQANVLPQATQNPPADAQPGAPEPKTSSPSVAAPGKASPANPKKHTYVRRNGGDGESRESTLAMRPLIDKDVQQRMDDLRSQLAEDMAKTNTADLQKRMEDAQRQMADASARLNSQEFWQRMDDLRRQMAEDMAKTNTADLQKRMEDAQRQVADASARLNSQEFRQRMDDLRRQMAEDMAKTNTADLQKRMEDAQRQMADAATKFNSPEFKQRMDDLQKQVKQQMEEFSRKAATHSPNP
jgi:beta-lactamase regulating signal transducer with metallopeptidase domain